MGKFLYKIQTAARCDDLPLELKKPVARNGMPLVGNNLMAADQASVNFTSVCTYSEMGSKTEQRSGFPSSSYWDECLFCETHNQGIRSFLLIVLRRKKNSITNFTYINWNFIYSQCHLIYLIRWNILQHTNVLLQLLKAQRDHVDRDRAGQTLHWQIDFWVLTRLKT